jgi:hypothetical protein
MSLHHSSTLSLLDGHEEPKVPAEENVSLACAEFVPHALRLTPSPLHSPLATPQLRRSTKRHRARHDPSGHPHFATAEQVFEHHTSAAAQEVSARKEEIAGILSEHMGELSEVETARMLLKIEALHVRLCCVCVRAGGRRISDAAHIIMSSTTFSTSLLFLLLCRMTRRRQCATLTSC